jgi:hypothetical protein
MENIHDKHARSRRSVMGSEQALHGVSFVTLQYGQENQATGGTFSAARSCSQHTSAHADVKTGAPPSACAFSARPSQRLQFAGHPANFRGDFHAI